MANPAALGIRLTPQVSGHTEFLHGGRARILPEAILRHGDQTQRDAVIALPKPDRAALIVYLESF